jgi:hypothetical protein
MQQKRGTPCLVKACDSGDRPDRLVDTGLRPSANLAGLGCLDHHQGVDNLGPARCFT